MLTRIKERNGHLDPAMNPALRTYGPAVSAVAVGLFGLGVLSSVDPGLAMAMPPVPDEPGRGGRGRARWAHGSAGGGGSFGPVPLPGDGIDGRPLQVHG
ncbi:hypothetical protein GCM10009557_43960 [Virgisporangium ochraceum]|uniref:Uncharacterized protein n=1 Tax=Virgisporangium ochraceum TaxID=65505 RepID=A0A8J4EFE2_9ACTN|nr:hypothetical protein [Virgisporangium ochraceum]GIJ72729.1 hypothetical protein Voc01_076460 [Virgisporangium ochraceum]